MACSACNRSQVLKVERIPAQRVSSPPQAQPIRLGSRKLAAARPIKVSDVDRHRA